jgi:hypothetical protein
MSHSGTSLAGLPSGPAFGIGQMRKSALKGEAASAPISVDINDTLRESR